MEEIPNNHLGRIKNPFNSGINYQPQLVNSRRISEPSTVCLVSGMLLVCPWYVLTLTGYETLSLLSTGQAAFLSAHFGTWCSFLRWRVFFLGGGRWSEQKNMCFLMSKYQGIVAPTPQTYPFRKSAILSLCWFSFAFQRLEMYVSSLEGISSIEQWKKPWSLSVYKGLYYPTIRWLYNKTVESILRFSSWLSWLVGPVCWMPGWPPVSFENNFWGLDH